MNREQKLELALRLALQMLESFERDGPRVSDEFVALQCVHQDVYQNDSGDALKTIATALAERRWSDELEDLTLEERSTLFYPAGECRCRACFGVRHNRRIQKYAEELLNA